MKHDDFYDKLYELAEEYRKVPWFRFLKTHRLKKEINRRWNKFIEEISNEQEDIRLSHLVLAVAGIQPHQASTMELPSLP
jgi:hypothetical protein